MSVKLYIQDVNQIGFNEVVIDLSRPISVNLGVKDFTEVTGTKNNLSFFSYTIDIPYEVNARALSHAIDINVTTARELVGIELSAFLESNFITYRGFLKINSYSKNEGGAYTLKAQFLGGIKNWVTLLPTYLRNLELGKSLFTEPEIRNVFNDNDPYDGSISIWYSLKFYEKFYRSDYIQTLDLKPDIYLAAVIKAIEKASKVPIRSQYFATEYFRRQIMPYMGNGKMIYEFFSAELFSDISTAPGDSYFLDMTDPGWVTDPLGAISPSHPFGWVPIVDDGLLISVYLDFNISTSKTGVNAVLKDEFSNFKDQVSLTNGQNNIVLTGEYTGGEAIVVEIEGDHTIITGSTLRVEIESLMPEGYKLLHRSVIPNELKTTDFISAISDLANLIWFYDESADSLIVEPKYPVTLPTGEYIPGFYHQGLIENYSEYVDCAVDEGDFTLNSNLKRNLLFVFKKDDDDKTVVNKAQWGHTEVLTPKFPDGESRQENELFAPTINKAISEAHGGTNAPAIAPYFKNEDEPEQPNFDFEPRILYKLGVLPYEWRFNSTSLTTGVPIAAQVLVPDVAVPPGQPEFANLGYGDYQGRSGIINTFYSTDLDVYKFGVRKKLRLSVPLKALFDMEKLFRYLKFVNTKTTHGFFILETFQITVNQDKISEIDLIALP